MSTDEAELVIAVWDIVRDRIPHDKRSDVARDLIYAFQSYGFDRTDLMPIVDEDPDLTDAYEEVFQETESEEDEIDEDE